MIRQFCFVLLLFAAVAFSSAVQGQVILVGASQLNFNAIPGGSSVVQTFPISSTGGAQPFTLQFISLSGGPWLAVSQASGTLPANILIAANAATLAPSIYTGTLRITAVGASNSPLDIPVTFNVGVVGSTTVTAQPTSLTFTGQVGGVNPLSQGLVVGAVVNYINYIATPSVANGAGWLLVSPPSGTAPAALNVSVVTQGMTAGTYYGSITITPSAGPPVVVPVTLILGSNSSVTVSNSSLNFYYQAGGTYPASQNIHFTSDNGVPANFSLTPTPGTGGNWLSVTPLSGNSPQTVTVSASPNGLAPGTYTATIAVSSPTAVVSVQTINVNLIVGASALLTLGTAPAPFSYQTGNVAPASQSVSIGSTSGPLTYGVSAATTAGNWLSVGPQSGVTPATLTVGVNPSSLGPGTYFGVVTVTSAGAANSPQSFTVKLTVNGTSTLTAAPTALNFSYQIGGTAPVGSQSIAVTTGNTAATISASVSTSTCGNWIQVYPSAISSTPGSFTVGVLTSAITTPQLCTGQVTLLNSANGASIIVPVTLNASTSPLLNVSPGSLTFTLPYNASISDAQTIALTSTDGSAIQFNASPLYSIGGTWLIVGPAAGKTPANLAVYVNPNSLNPGSYTGGVTVISSGLPAPVTVPVTMNITPVTIAAAAPSALAFTQTVGGAAPPAQSLVITSQSGSFPFTVTPATNSGLGWLKASVSMATTPATITISTVATSLPVGNYSGSVSIDMPGASNSPLIVPVTLNIAQLQGISALPASMNFSYQMGALQNPADQVIAVSGTGGLVPFSTSASTAGNGNWLRVTPLISSTPGTVTVSANPSGLAVGTYSGQVTIVSQGAVGSPIQIPVSLVVLPAAAPAIDQLINAASGARGPIAVGEIVTIKGVALGPVTPAQFRLVSGRVDTTLAEARVLFDGYPAPVLYASAAQINAIVPYEISGRQLVQVQVEYQNTRSQSLTVSMVSAAPGIFTAGSTGTGQGAVLNQDSTPNAAGNPAARGSIIQVFATGEGQTNPVGVSGTVTGSVLPKPVLEVTATIDGQPADVTYAGAAPGAIAGLFQVNIRVPEAAASRSDAPVVISVGGVPSQNGVIVAVR